MGFPDLREMKNIGYVILRNCLINDSIPAYIGDFTLLKTLFARGKSKNERSYTLEEQEEIEKFQKELDQVFAPYSYTYVRPANYMDLEVKNAAIREEKAALSRKDKAALKRKYLAKMEHLKKWRNLDLEVKNAAIREEKAALSRKDMAALKGKYRAKMEHLKKWRNLNTLFDRSNFEESYKSIHWKSIQWRCEAGAEVPSTHDELHEMLQFVRDHYAKFALQYYNDKNMGTKYELVEGLKLFPFPGPRIEHIKYPNLGDFTIVTQWCHINFMAKPINAHSADPTEAKLFFAEMYGIYRKDSESVPGITQCCIVESNNSDGANCECCKGVFHPAGVEFIASPLVRGFEKSLR